MNSGSKVTQRLDKKVILVFPTAALICRCEISGHLNILETKSSYTHISIKNLVKRCYFNEPL